MYTYSMFWYVWLVFVVLFCTFYCLSIFCLVDRFVYVGYSVVCMVRSGGFFSSYYLTPFFSLLFLTCFVGGVGELSVNKYGCVVGKRVVYYYVFDT